MVQINGSIIRKTQEFWQKKTSSIIADESARSIAKNLLGFFDVLSRWEENAKATSLDWFFANIPWISIGMLNQQNLQIPFLRIEDVLIVVEGNKNQR